MKALTERMLTRTLTAGAVAIAGMAGLSSPADAAYVLVDDFESYANGSAINGQADWTSSTSIKVKVDPADSSNQVLEVVGDQTSARSSDPAIGIADNTTGTLFLRFRMSAAGVNASFGLTPVDTPSDFDDFRAQGRLAFGKLDTRNGGSFADLASANNDQADQLNNWYRLWMVINNSSDTVRYYVQSDDDPDFATQTELTVSAGDISFRTAAAAALDRLFLRNGGNAQAAFFDDIWIDTTAENLANPIPEPTALSLLALAALPMLRRRRL